jgi:Tol biopolymer transport system component
VLNADGTETRLVVHRPGARYIYPGGSFSPDGSEVIFATYRGGIYAVDADGGTPRLLRRSIRYVFVNPMFSADGTKIAYFEIRDMPGHTLRVMNADGTGDRVLLGSQAVDCYYPSLVRPAWSPDGTHIAFSCDDYGIRVVGADGSGLRTVIPNEDALGPLWDLGFGIPYWSPDGARIAFEVLWDRDMPHTHRGPAEIARLAIADADGTHVRVFEYPAVAGPWNPLPLSEPGETNPTATRGSDLATPLLYAIALVVLVGVLIGGCRARGKFAARS